MNLNGVLISILSWFAILPAAILCIAPMRNQLKKGLKVTLVRLLSLLLVLIPVAVILESTILPGYNSLLPLVALITFVVYHKSLTVPLCKSLSVYLVVFTYMSFMSNFANGFDAAIHPNSFLDNFSLEGAIFQAVVTTLFSIVAYYPLRRFGGFLIDRFDIDRIWYLSLPVMAIFLGYNLIIAPKKYETIHINDAFIFYWLSLILLLVLLTLYCIAFYFIILDMMGASEARERNRILEMQESAYLSQQRYLNESAKVRHDFKHVIGTLNTLIVSGDYESAKEYINDYMASQPAKETIMFCHNSPVNALINYYYRMAKDADIDTSWEISLPEDTGISDLDLCNILGNIIENAIHACKTIPTEERFIDLTLRFEEEGTIYIVTTNSFDGKVLMNKGEYQSTKAQGAGIGLRSIKETAAKYGGSVRFSHTEDEFNTDVILPKNI